jgi:hypothetical protein
MKSIRLKIAKNTSSKIRMKVIGRIRITIRRNWRMRLVQIVDGSGIHAGVL